MTVQDYLKIVLSNMKKREIVGNAHSDHDLLNELPAFAVVACQLNAPDIGFEAYDYLGTDIMSVDPLTWEQFESGIREVVLYDVEESEARRQEENEDASWPFGRPKGF